MGIPGVTVESAGLSAAFLQDELERSREGELTGDCRDGSCAACGVCEAGIGMDLIA